MKRLICIIIMMFILIVSVIACADISESTQEDRGVVEKQQQIYAKAHPIPFFEYSIPRDIFTQIYEIVTTRAYVTYTVIESMTGKTFYHGPSIGYGIPADTSITNPMAATLTGFGSSRSIDVVEQPEPNGLFSSKNTDGTWVLFIQNDGSITPIYTEHKVTTFPFEVVQEDGIWVRADNKPVDFIIDIK